MTFEVRIKKWHAVASWTWNAGAHGRRCTPLVLAAAASSLSI